jgi:integrase/recombinase XerD
MPPHAIHARLTKITLRRFGRSMSSHVFRHDLATTVAIEDPEHIGIAPDLLHHASSTPTERYYILAHGLKASRAHASLIADLRRRPEVETAATEKA